MFSKHHYLNHLHNDAASVYVAFVNNKIAGFLSVLHFPHPKVKNLKRVHRLVILPDYQGAGFGIKFLEEIGHLYKSEKNRYSITTSSPSLIHSLKNRDNWRCITIGRNKPHGGQRNGSNMTGNFGSFERITASFEMK